MGEIAEMMLDGSLCQDCGQVIGDGNSDGFPVTCDSCLKQNARKNLLVGDWRAKVNITKTKPGKQKMKRYPCNICGKSFAVMAQHLHYAHGIKSHD